MRLASFGWVVIGLSLAGVARGGPPSVQSSGASGAVRQSEGLGADFRFLIDPAYADPAEVLSRRVDRRGNLLPGTEASKGGITTHRTMVADRCPPNPDRAPVVLPGPGAATAPAPCSPPTPAASSPQWDQLLSAAQRIDQDRDAFDLLGRESNGQQIVWCGTDERKPEDTGALRSARFQWGPEPADLSAPDNSVECTPLARVHEEFKFASELRSVSATVGMVPGSVISGGRSAKSERWLLVNAWLRERWQLSTPPKTADMCTNKDVAGWVSAIYVGHIIASTLDNAEVRAWMEGSARSTGGRVGKTDKVSGSTDEGDYLRTVGYEITWCDPFYEAASLGYASIVARLDESLLSRDTISRAQLRGLADAQVDYRALRIHYRKFPIDLGSPNHRTRRTVSGQYAAATGQSEACENADGCTVEELKKAGTKVHGAGRPMSDNPASVLALTSPYAGARKEETGSFQSFIELADRIGNGELGEPTDGRPHYGTQTPELCQVAYPSKDDHKAEYCSEDQRPDDTWALPADNTGQREDLSYLANAWRIGELDAVCDYRRIAQQELGIFESFEDDSRRELRWADCAERLPLPTTPKTVPTTPSQPGSSGDQQPGPTPTPSPPAPASDLAPGGGK